MICNHITCPFWAASNQIIRRISKRNPIDLVAKGICATYICANIVTLDDIPSSWWTSRISGEPDPGTRICWDNIASSGPRSSDKIMRSLESANTIGTVAKSIRTTGIEADIISLYYVTVGQTCLSAFNPDPGSSIIRNDVACTTGSSAYKVLFWISNKNSVSRISQSFRAADICTNQIALNNIISTSVYETHTCLSIGRYQISGARIRTTDKIIWTVDYTNARADIAYWLSSGLIRANIVSLHPVWSWVVAHENAATEISWDEIASAIWGSTN